MIKNLVPMALMAALLAGCATDGNGPGAFQTGGTALGAIAGGLAGAQFGKASGKVAMTAVGTLLGAYAGSQIGKSLDSADKAYADRAEEEAHAAPIGQQVNWNNPDSGNSGSYTATRDGYDQSGDYCRDYQTAVSADGKQQQATGTACRQPDGSWKVVK